MIIKSEKLNKDEIGKLIKKKVNPQELGVQEPEMRPGKEGVVIMSSSKTGLDRLKDYIANDPELGTKLTTKQPKQKKLEMKVVGIDKEQE